MSRFKLTNRHKVKYANEAQFCVIVEYSYLHNQRTPIEQTAQYPKAFGTLESAQDFVNAVLPATKSALGKLVGTVPGGVLAKVLKVDVLEYAADGSIYTYDVIDNETGETKCQTSTGR